MFYTHAKKCLQEGLQRMSLSDRYFGVWVPEKRAAWLKAKIGNPYSNPDSENRIKFLLLEW